MQVENVPFMGCFVIEKQMEIKSSPAILKDGNAKGESI